MKVVVLGATGTIGSALADMLAADHHEVVRVSRKSEISVDVRDEASVNALFAKVKDIDALVSCAGEIQGAMGAFDTLTRAQFELGIQWQTGTALLVQAAQRHVKDGGSITVTTGALVTQPRPGVVAGVMPGGAIETLVRAASLEMPRGIRLNAVSPGWVKETMEKWGMDSSPGMPAKTLARIYARAIDGTMNGTVIDATAG